MKARTVQTLLKSKFIRKYKGPSGKMIYVYRLPTGRHARVAAEEIIHSLKTLKAMYKRRAPGQGGARSITSKADLDLVLSKTTFCMISAGKNPDIPSEKKLTAKDLKARDTQLRSDLVKAGYIYTPSQGKWGVSEESMFVMCHDANRKQLIALGTTYNQNSVLFVHDGHSELIETTGSHIGDIVMVGEGHEYVPDTSDFYTEVNIAGKPIKFTMNLAEIVKAIRRFVIGLWKGRNDYGY